MVEYHLTNGARLMVRDASLLIALVKLVDAIPLPASPPRRGQPTVYSDRLFLKALVIMIVRGIWRAHRHGMASTRLFIRSSRGF